MELNADRRQRHIDNKYHELINRVTGAFLYGKEYDQHNEAELFLIAYELGKLDATKLVVKDFLNTPLGIV